MVDLNNKTVLCTGGNGFIGSNFIEYLFRNYKNLSVINIDKHGMGWRSMDHLKYLEDNNGYIELVENIRDIQVNTKIDYVFHFAAESHVDRSISGPSPFIENNVMGIVTLLEWARTDQPHVKIINISTDEVYGHLNVGDAPFTEKSPLKPRSPYSASKASADLIANSYVETFGLNVITTRCCNNYGPHQGDEKFIPTVIRNIVNGTPIPVYGTGKNMREWIFVEDHNKSILEIAKWGRNGTVYNIGSGVELENLQLIDDIKNIIGVAVAIEFVEDRKGHDFRYAIESIRYYPDFKRRDYKDALVETVRFYQTKYQNLGK